MNTPSRHDEEGGFSRQCSAPSSPRRAVPRSNRHDHRSRRRLAGPRAACAHPGTAGGVRSLWPLARASALLVPQPAGGHAAACGGTSHRTTSRPTSSFLTVEKFTPAPDDATPLSGRRRAREEGDQEWARTSLFSAPRPVLFGILFVGGHESGCAVAIDPPSPIPRSRSRPLGFSFTRT